MSEKCKKNYNFKDTYFPISKEQYYVLFIYKKNIWKQTDHKDKRKLVFYNYSVINYRCNFINMGEITEYKRVLYTELQQLICMNTKKNAYIYILLKINKESKEININNKCNNILELNKKKKINKYCIESNFHNSFINLLNLNNISYYSDEYDNDSSINKNYDQHLLISKIEFNLIYCNLTKLLENQKQTLLNICRQMITNIRLKINNDDGIFNKFMTNNLYNDELFYILENINEISNDLISKYIEKINKYYSIFLELCNITITEESIKINETLIQSKGYIKIKIEKMDEDEYYALLPCHLDWSSNNIELDGLSDEINKITKELYETLSKTENEDEIRKIKNLYIKERIFIKYGDMSQNKKDIYDTCIEKECIEKIDKKRFTKLTTKMQINPRVTQYFTKYKDSVDEIFTDSNRITI